MPTARMVALLRGVNLASRRRVSMSELRNVLAGHGHEDVTTYLQSGNVVLTSGLPPRRLERELEQQIAAGLGIEVDVLVRTRDELADVVACDPFAGVADDGSRYLVTFLSAQPKAAVVRRLATLHVDPERFELSGREVYSWHPEGVGRSPLRSLFYDLGVSATARNWNTVLKLLELAG
jgi:uncharacterized protein (DUF1697 family)